MPLRVLSLNAWCLPFAAASHVGERLEAIIQRIPSYDADVMGVTHLQAAYVASEDEGEYLGMRIDLMLVRAGGRLAATPRAMRRVFDEEIPLS